MKQSLHNNQLNSSIKLLERFENEIGSGFKSAVFCIADNKQDKKQAFYSLNKVLTKILTEIEFVNANRTNIGISESINDFIYRLANLNCIKLNKDSLLQVFKESEVFIKFLSQLFDKQEINQLNQEIQKSITDLENNPFVFLECQDEFKSILNRLENYSGIVQVAGLDLKLFEGLPVEPPYSLNDKETPRLVLKDLFYSIKYSLLELDAICNSDEPKINLLRLVNNEYRIQIGSNAFLYVDEPQWKGWIYKDKPAKKYKDLVAYELPGIISGLIHDLKQTIKFSNEKNYCLKDAFECARKERAVTLELNLQAYHNWPKEERSFRTIKSRYKKPFIVSSILVILVLLLVAFKSGNYGILSFQIVDSAITWLLFILMGYIIYLCLYGLIGKLGVYTISKKDIVDVREIILSDQLKLKSSLLSDFDYKNSKKIENIDNWLTYCTLFIKNLTESRKNELVHKYNLNVSGSIDVSLLNFIQPVVEKTSRNELETSIIRDVFPLQMIVIPAVNDSHVVELVNHKISKANYPNIVFLLALEERDKNTVRIIEDALKNNELKGQVYTYFGPVELNNIPGTQHKPKNKPKNVNKALCHFLAGLFEITENGFEKIPKPDYLMIWDLEDDPGEAQVWSMIIANTIIKTTCSNILEIIDKEGTPEKSLKHSHLRKLYPDTYRNVKRFGIDITLPKKLAAQYQKTALMVQKSNPIEHKNAIIHKLNIEADCIVLNNILRQEKEYKESNHFSASLLEKQKYLNILQSKYQKLKTKYDTEENFVAEEFNRRTVPVDTQGILVARLYGDSSMSHLEWVMWFELILPGLMRFRYDYTIFAGAFAGLIFGALTSGFYMSILFSIIGVVLGIGVGWIFNKLGFDTRNKIGLSFSAGTTNNFDFDTLTDTISIYPEYNVAEDWSIALRLAKMKYRSLLINGYNTPTYEDSLAPLGPRMWAQHSRWIGGHFQSFPQVFVGFKRIFSQFGLANWMHSILNIVVLSLAPLLTAYVLFKSFIALSSLVIYYFSPKYYDFWWVDLLVGIKIFFWKLAWWVPNDSYTGIILLLAGPILLLILGAIPILFHRSDDSIMVKKSVEDLKRQFDEFQNFKNEDIQKLECDINYLKSLSERIQSTENKNISDKIYSQVNKDLENAELSYKLKLVKGFWDDKGNQQVLQKIVKSTGENSAKILNDIAIKLTIKLKSLLERKTFSLKKKIYRCENGEINLGLFKLRLGQYTYAFYLKLLLNIGMIYYYLHSTMAVILYFGQINKNMDSMWRQTGHRHYGKGFSGEIKKEFKRLSKEYIKN